MSKVLVIANGAAYGNESLFNALRLSITLKEQHPETQLNIFLMSDAVTGALAHQQPKEGYNLQQMLEILTAQNVPVDGAELGTLVDLAQWTLDADKILTF